MMERPHAEQRPYILTLSDAAAAVASRVGAKAANLARLMAAGFPVPEGVVLTTDTLAGDGALPDEVAAALEEALGRFRGQPLAVRSSSVAEDLEDSSFAGQYETVLGVQELPEVLAAVETCRRSATDSRVAAYRASRQAKTGAMAVLIQPLVKAEAAGVAFTANPVTGDRAETLVSAVRGLGERLVLGEATPDEWRVKDGRATCRSAPEGALTEEQVLAVSELAHRVEAYFGEPQDIEWAWSVGKLWLLQARPITTLPEPAHTPVPVPVTPPAEGFWQREVSHYPLPLSPLARTLLLPMVNHGFRTVFAEFALLIETIDHIEIGGWVYNRVVPLGGKDRRPPPAWLAPVLFKLIPPLRMRIRANVEVLRSDKAGRLIERWYTEWRPQLIERNSALGEVDLPPLSDAALLAHIRTLRQHLKECIEIHFLLNGSLNFLLAEFFLGCRDLVGWDESKCLEVLNGLSETSSAPARALTVLANRARQKPELCKLIAAGIPQTERLAAADPKFGSALAEYIHRWARRTIGYDIAEPTLAERPDLLVSLIHGQMVREYDGEAKAEALAARRAEAAKEARAQLAGRPESDREQFERLLRRAERAYPVREDHGFVNNNVPVALTRYACLEAGSRLAHRSQLASQEDVFFLEADELEAALQDGRPYHSTVNRRRGERAWVMANPGPASYGTPPASPSFAGLPEESRRAHEAVMWALERAFAPEASNRKQVAASELDGIAASAGLYTGPVRVIRDEHEFQKIQPGDVLVCPITSPVWSILFASVGALVTDTGGILSHSGIIAREYRIPAVVATGNATELLRDGQIVTVDGSGGRVIAAAT